jgi:starch phosphorylase
MNIARYLVQGVDVWLNTPRRPKEASGTSGMKGVYNGVLNCSILDGWWAEGYDPTVGWAIGNGEEYPEYEWDHQDYVESEALYNILEHDIIPMFYDRGRDTLPRDWIAKVKNGYRKLAPYFNTHRMVQEYADQLYMPASKRSFQLLEDNLQTGLSYAAWRKTLESAWKNIHIRKVDVSQKTVKVSSQLEVDATIDLGSLKPNDVHVQLYYGALTPRGEIGAVGQALDMQPNGSNGGGEYHFTAKLTYDTSGERGISVRVLPSHSCLPTPFVPGLIQWAD